MCGGCGWWVGGLVCCAQGASLLENILSCTYCGCIFAVTVLRGLDMPAQSAMLALASIAGWTYMLFFLMAFRLTGPFVVMIHQMLFNDVLRFVIIYSVFLAGFSQAFFVLVCVSVSCVCTAVALRGVSEGLICSRVLWCFV